MLSVVPATEGPCGERSCYQVCQQALKASDPDNDGTLGVWCTDLATRFGHERPHQVSCGRHLHMHTNLLKVAGILYNTCILTAQTRQGGQHWPSTPHSQLRHSSSSQGNLAHGTISAALVLLILLMTQPSAIVCLN